MAYIQARGEMAMKYFTTTSIVAIALATFTGAAMAGSYTPPPVEPMTTPPAAAHDWTGWYGDVYVGRWVNPALGNYFGANIGYLTGSSTFLYGGELGLLSDPSPGPYSQVTIDGRVAAPVSDNAMVFGNLGLGRDNTAVTFVEYSIGGQYAFSDSMYMRGEIVGQTAIIGAVGSNSSVRLGVGLEF